MHGGTFTITNPGQFGAQFGMPIINQPQVAILGVGTIEKRPVVVDDAIAIARWRIYLRSRSTIADRRRRRRPFMALVKNQLENFDARSERARPLEPDLRSASRRGSPTRRR